MSFVPFLDDVSFIVMAFAARILQGAGHAFQQTGSTRTALTSVDFSLHGAVFPNKIPGILLFYQISLGCGFFMGPMAGSFLVEVSFEFMYIVFSKISAC